jgi:lantibiotic modifying enzyme
MSWGPVATGVGHHRATEGGPFGNLAGFSHGAGGVGWALTELFAATGEPRFREAVAEAFRYERHWYDEERRNWGDLRDPAVMGTPEDSEPSCMRGWCHGAGGIALARLRAWQVFGEDLYLEEAEVAVETSRSALEPGPELSQNNYSLCHGRGGNAEPLLYGAEVLGRPAWRRAAENVGLEGVEDVHAMKLPWPCGTQRNVEIPSLLVGLAGIGYFYLRLADPQATPSVMIFPAPAGSAEEES